MAASPTPVKKAKSKAVDKWKLKKKIDVVAPDIFNNVVIGPIFAEEPESVIGRTVETTLSKLVNSNQHHIKIMLKVVGLKGFTAQTVVKAIEISRAYISSQVSPGTDVIEGIFVVKTTDNKRVRIKTLMFTRRKSHASQKTELRSLTEEAIKSSSDRLDYDHFVQEVVFGKVGSQIFNKGKRVIPLGRVEIRKLELMPEKKS
jgi:small subunit ribosomal protein S3Ae